MNWILLVIFGVFVDLSEEGAAWLQSYGRRRTKMLKTKQHLVLCFYLAAGKVRFKAVINTKVWQEDFYLSAAFESAGSAVKTQLKKKSVSVLFSEMKRSA